MNTGKEKSIDEIIDQVVECLDQDKPVRFELPGGGRLHIDRVLPFLCIHRRQENYTQVAAEQLCSANASYLITGRPDDDVRLINAVADIAEKRCGGFMIFECSEFMKDELIRDDSPYLTPFEIWVSADRDELERSKELFCKTVLGVDPKYRKPRIKTQDREAAQAERDKHWPDLSDRAGLLRVHFEPIYIQPESQLSYPELLERIVAILYDAALVAIDAHARSHTTFKPFNHRSLGRQVLLDSAFRVDRQLDKICSSFDFLLSVTPINSDAAWKDFSNSKYRTQPQFYYRPLPIDAGTLKRKLYDVSFDHIEDPVLIDLFKEKQREIDIQLTMLQARNTSLFKDCSRLLYGSIEPPLKALAANILSDTENLQSDQASSGSGGSVDCFELQSQAVGMVKKYKNEFSQFAAEIEIRDDVPAGMMVSGPRLLISSHSHVASTRVQALLNHEVGVHLLTFFNGNAQGLRLFRNGLAGYEGVQEGLAVFAEYASGALTTGRLRLLAARVLACEAVLDGSAFHETFQLMIDTCKLPVRGAYHVTMRAHRGGGLSKDAIYLRGLMEVLNHLKNGGNLEPFWIGKIAMKHLTVVQELRSRGLLKPIPVAPLFTVQTEAMQRISAASDGLSPLDLIAA